MLLQSDAVLEDIWNSSKRYRRRMSLPYPVVPQRILTTTTEDNLNIMGLPTLTQLNR